MNRLQSHENGSNSPKFYVNSPAINRKFVKIGSHFHEISLRSPNYQTRSKNVVWDLVKKYGKKAKIRKNVHPHTFRHSCATAMLKNKADLNTIRKILGHTSLNTTQIYTHLNITDLKAVHKQCHPREKDKE